MSDGTPADAANKQILWVRSSERRWSVGIALKIGGCLEACC